MKNLWNHVYTLLVNALIFVTPLNLFLKITEAEAYVHGLYSDYLIPKLFVSDLVMMGILGVWIIDHRSQLMSLNIRQKLRQFFLQNSKVVILTVLICITIVMAQFTSARPLTASIQVLKIVMIVLVGLVLFSQRHVFQKQKITIWVVVITMLFQSLLGMYQFFQQQPLAPYYVFGETQLTQAVGITKLEINGTLRVAPYGSTSHPNILGGVLVIYLLITMLLTPAYKPSPTERVILRLTQMLTLCVILLTASFSAWLALLIGVAVIRGSAYWRRVIGWGSLVMLLVMPILLQLWQYFYSISDPSITRRIVLNQAALELWLQHPILGVGIQNFTAYVDHVSQSQEIVRFIQPAHHSVLLWLSETGILGILLILLLLVWNWQRKKNGMAYLQLQWLAPFIPILSLDHYLLTSQTGLLLIMWWILVVTSLATRVDTLALLRQQLTNRLRQLVNFKWLRDKFVRTGFFWHKLSNLGFGVR
jgi:O-antigen ligase